MSKQQQLFGFLAKTEEDKVIDPRIAASEISNIQPNPNPNNSTKKYEQLNINYRPSDLGDVCPKRINTCGRAPGTSFGHQIRRFTDNMYSGRNWIEYSFERDAVFWYPCNKFSSNNHGK